MCIHYSLLRRLAMQLSGMLCFIVLSVTVYTVGYICLFRRDPIFIDFVSFLSMKFMKYYIRTLSFSLCNLG